MQSMPNALAKLPDDIDALKALVAEQLARNTRLEQEKVRLNAKVLTLQEQLNLALARRYAASSEKLSPDQIRLFNEAEVDAALDDCGHDEADPEETVAVPAHNRKKGGRKPLPENWPRIEVIHEIPEGQRHCPHDGQLLIEINQIVSEQADIIPAQLRVIRHIRKQYACACGQCIQTAPLPGQPIPKSMASPGLLAHIAVSKYQDALPLYRQEQILQRVGLTIPRATLANWMIRWAWRAIISSCVTMMNAVRASAWCCRMTSKTRAALPVSRLPVGSSASTTLGVWTSARARCSGWRASVCSPAASRTTSTTSSWASSAIRASR